MVQCFTKTLLFNQYMRFWNIHINSFCISIYHNFFLKLHTIGFKSTFLVEILSNIDTPTIVIELADSTRAGVFKPVYDDKQSSATLMLLMPMMINA